jgi:uncharacterized membrane protein YqjE
MPCLRPRLPTTMFMTVPGRLSVLRAPMRLLWSLPKAAPALLRHLAGYVELAGQDLEQTQRDFTARLRAAAIIGVSLFFVVLSGCLLVVALTWDTPHRVAAIAWMGGAFLVVALIAALYGSSALRAQTTFLATVQREWQVDRVLVEQLLSSNEHPT